MMIGIELSLFKTRAIAEDTEIHSWERRPTGRYTCMQSKTETWMNTTLKVRAVAIGGKRIVYVNDEQTDGFLDRMWIG